LQKHHPLGLHYFRVFLAEALVQLHIGNHPRALAVEVSIGAQFAGAAGDDGGPVLQGLLALGARNGGAEVPHETFGLGDFGSQMDLL
jgi:hypothetical protein